MNPNRKLSASIPVSFTIPGFEPEKARMRMEWTSAAALEVRLFFVADANPLDEVQWVVSRDMFIDCYSAEPGEHYGEGDALIERGDVTTFLTLNSPEGLAGISFESFTAIELILKSMMICPRGEQESESLADELDSWLEAALSEGL